MDEEEETILDYRTPKGKLIQLVEQKLKKPEIDDSLGKVLDKFLQLTSEQTTYLENGIFHMNFAEDALLLQSCGQYYGKRVDKLWDELLTFHTRMVNYDKTTTKNSDDSNKKEARKQEIARLEERLNRGKRKKIVLAEPETDAVPTKDGCFLIEHDQPKKLKMTVRNKIFPYSKDDLRSEGEQEDLPLDYDFEVYDQWAELMKESKIEKEKNYNSDFVMEYNKLKYNFKPYPSPYFNELIYDMTDPEECNTKEGKLISCQIIQQMFEDNDNCLVPDDNFVIARLRIAYVLKKKWLIKNKIDPTADYETYKDAWENYEREFFAEEKRKIQNMPQRNSEETVKFFKALARKEEIAKEKVEKLREMGVKDLPVINFQSVIVEPLKEDYDGIFDPYIPEGFEVPDEPVLNPAEDPAVDKDDEIELEMLFGNDPLKSSTPHPSNQNRSDSGYDAGFDADDDESDHEEEEEHSKIPEEGTDTPFFEFGDTENRDAVTPNPSESSADNLNNITDLNESDPNMDPSVINEETGIATEESGIANKGSQIAARETREDFVGKKFEETISDVQREKMNNAIKEFVKHDNLLYKTLENSFFDETDGIITIIYDKPLKQNENNSDSDEEITEGDKIMLFGYFYKYDELAAKLPKKLFKKKDNNKNEECTNQENSNNMKRKLEKSTKEYDTTPKRRKLSKRQIEKLKKSRIDPVNEQKWESFFSYNYKPETGEGEITQINYQSDSEDDIFDDIDEDNADLHTHSEHETDRERCQSKSPFPITQDSGINMDLSFNESRGISESDILNGTLEVREDDKSAEISTDINDTNKNTNILHEESKDEEEHITPKERETRQMKERVEEWRNHITPTLKKLEDHEFDIHEYGSNIMGSMNINESKSFGEIVSGKSSAEVVRYFISSLQLANTLNVQICGAQPGQLANDTFELKLLRKERYHEHLQEYQAPSEENLHDKLKKIQEIEKQNKMAQTIKNQHPKRKIFEDEDYQPEERIRETQTSTIRSKSSRASSKKKIKTLNYEIRSPSQDNFEYSLNDSQIAITSNGNVCQTKKIDFQQPSTSWQADMADQQGFIIDSAISEIGQTPTRSSIDSGFIPSCDEDFLEQFDQLQHIGDPQFQSTPGKPRKLLKIRLV